MTARGIHLPWRDARFAALLLLTGLSIQTAWTAEAGAPEAETTRKLVGVLASDASTFEKARACQQLARIGTAEAIPAAAALLADEKLSNYARDVLESVADPAADAALREALGKVKGNLLIGVVNSIGVRRDAKAVESITTLARDPASGAAPEALLALGHIATPEALAVLRRALAEGPRELQVAAAEGCLLCAERMARDGKQKEAIDLYDVLCKLEGPAFVQRAAVRGSILSRGRDGFPRLLELLRAEDSEAREQALGVLREIPGADAAKLVVAELERAKPELRVLLLHVLVDQRDPASLSTIEKLASGESPEARQLALSALGRIGGASSVPVLLKVLESEENPADAAVALTSLSQIDVPEADALILKALPVVAAAHRARLVGVLGRRRSSENAIGELVRLAVDANTAVSQAALSALAAQAQPKDLPELIRLATTCTQDAVRDAAERGVSETCLRIANVAGRSDPVSVALRNSKDSAARCALVRILGLIGDFKASSVVVPLLKDPDEKVRDAALRSLTNWPDATPTAALLRFAGETDVPVQRVLALRGIVRLAGATAAETTYPSRQTIDWLTQANRLITDGADERKLILSGLGNLKCVEGLVLVQPYLADARVADEAALAAIQIARQMVPGDGRRMAKWLLEKIHQTAKNPAVVGQAGKLIKEIAGEALELKAPVPMTDELDPSKLTFKPLFDGTSFNGWNGETFKAFRIEDGVVVGGSMKAPLAQNEFLCTNRAYADFVLRLECKVTGSNAGIQIRSRRVPASSEVCGYQADMDSTGRYWGCLYDESRRGMLIQADTKKVMEIVKKDDWNRYEVRCRGPRIQLFVNGLPTADYTEKDESVLLSGLIGLQIHAGNPSEVRYRNVEIAELP